MEAWRRVAATQAGLITLSQLRACGVGGRAVERHVRSERWQRASPTVVCVTTGELSPRQRLWLGVLHGGSGSLVAGIHALQLAGLTSWARNNVVILVPYRDDVPARLVGFDFVRSRRDLDAMTIAREGLPCCRVEPAALLFGSREPFDRSAVGILAAVVQQRLTTPPRLEAWLRQLTPLRRAKEFRAALADIAGGAHSVSELDVRRMCKAFRIALPARQVRRIDAGGRVRYTDCEWPLPGGGTLVLEVEGPAHMSADAWEDDIARQRALSEPGRLIVRCTSRELRSHPDRVARDLLRLGAPPAAASGL